MDRRAAQHRQARKRMTLARKRRLSPRRPALKRKREKVAHIARIPAAAARKTLTAVIDPAAGEE